jgi:hypothetical protein
MLKAKTPPYQFSRDWRSHPESIPHQTHTIQLKKVQLSTGNLSMASSHSASSSVWHYKPWWCQPWSILLTGLTTILGSWWLLHITWVTLLVAIPVFIWMGFFLLVYPKLMAAEIAQLDQSLKTMPPSASDRQHMD